MVHQELSDPSGLVAVRLPPRSFAAFEGDERLWRAVAAGDADGLEAVLALEPRGGKAAAPLQMACERGDPKVLELLLQVEKSVGTR